MVLIYLVIHNFMYSLKLSCFNMYFDAFFIIYVALIKINLLTNSFYFVYICISHNTVVVIKYVNKSFTIFHAATMSVKLSTLVSKNFN